MLTRIDRVVLAVPDRGRVAQAWGDLLGAEVDTEDKVGGLRASRTRLRLGTGRVDLVEADGSGAVQDAVSRRGGHLYAAGAATPDLQDVIVALQQRGVDHVAEGTNVDGEVWVDAGHGLRMVIDLDSALDPVGRVDELYEVTNLVADADAAATAFADQFGLHPSAFEPIASTEYGYAGALTLFDPDHLHRIEVIHPHDGTKTMGRYYAKHGESLYMCFAETGELPAITDTLRDRDAPHTAVGDHTTFIHPQALGGAMVGLSRRTYAWTWSGHPERVEPVA
ncbi:MAG: hypothetical protein QOG87_882 [Actinomycetota bacterium]